MQHFHTYSHLHDPQEIVRVGALITDVERYDGIEPHPSRLAHFRASTLEDRYFWYLGRGGTSPVCALTPASFTWMFANWAFNAWNDCESDLAQAKANLKAHTPKAVSASVDDIGIGDAQSDDLALYYEYLMHRANLNVLPIKEGATATFNELDWNHAVVNACARMFCETLRSTRLFAYSDEGVDAVLRALRSGEMLCGEAL